MFILDFHLNITLGPFSKNIIQSRSYTKPVADFKKWTSEGVRSLNFGHFLGEFWIFLSRINVFLDLFYAFHEAKGGGDRTPKTIRSYGLVYYK